MLKEEAERFEEDMQIFSFSMHQNVVVYLNLLKSGNWKTEDVKRFVKFKTEELTKKEITDAPEITHCSECNRAMQLLPVNHTPATQTGDPTDRSVWLCRWCHHTVYNKKSVKELITELTTGGK